MKPITSESILMEFNTQVEIGNPKALLEWIDANLHPHQVFNDDTLAEWVRCKYPAKPISIQTAMEILIETLRKDKSEGSYYYSWQANIAMAFFDEVRRTCDNNLSDSAPYFAIDKDQLHGLSNRSAKNFLDTLLIETK